MSPATSRTTMPTIDPGAPFRLIPREGGELLLAPIARLIERVLGLRRLAELHAEVGVQPDVASYVARCLAVLGVKFDVPHGDVVRVPTEGKLVVVANHPFGALEGLLILRLLLSVRPDVKVVANHLLGRFEQLRPALLPVDAFGGAGARRRNGRPLKAAIRWLEDGHALVVFPAGEVAHRRRGERTVTDPEWNPIVGRIVRKTGAPVLPVFFGGDNGRLFQVAGRLHPRLRTVLLPRTLLNARGCQARARVGKLVDAGVIRRLQDDRECVDYLRLRTMVLGRNLENDGRAQGPRASAEQIIEPITADLLVRDVTGLAHGARLAAGGPFEVWLAKAEEIPNLLREIGRLREKTFRAIGEGTGRSLDLDRHDADYLHLFLWDPARREVAGAYRLGRTDQLLARGGLDALYTSSLFQLDQAFVEHVTPGLELGRSFVREERQRGYLPLKLLWQGICSFLVANPQYRRVFGPVSISAAYHSASRELMVDHLREHEFLPELAALVRPRRPVPSGAVRQLGLSWTPAMLRDIRDVSTMVAEMEHDAKGVPVLIREYLKFGGKVVGFNVDSAFADVVDGLVLADLDETDPKMLARYMGKAGAQRFLDVQAVPNVQNVQKVPGTF